MRRVRREPVLLFLFSDLDENIGEGFADADEEAEENENEEGPSLQPPVRESRMEQILEIVVSILRLVWAWKSTAILLSFSPPWFVFAPSFG